ncbi:MAG: DpnII family type II restriction endonuclease [Planctomycetota bacterium]|nr:DpnII family type II restriction endonuclease [Planctomycetota bacterium]
MNRMTHPSTDDKFNTVITQNTFYFQNTRFEEEYEGHISSLAQNLFLLKNKVEQDGLKESVLLEHILNVEDGLEALLTITGFSKESLLRLVTFIRVNEDKRLSDLVNKSAWPQEEFTNEWTLDKIKNIVKTNPQFADGLINLFFKGSTIQAIKVALPLFEFKKLDINKFTFSVESLVDTIIRYKTKGAYKADKRGNAEVVIEGILAKHKLTFERGKFGKIPRTMDFIIPDKKNPLIVVECAYSVTTASGMGDKAKTEKTVGDYLKKHYPKAVFVGFVDGIGWYVRRGDLKRMVAAYDEVFTFSTSELNRFETLLQNLVK